MIDRLVQGLAVGSELTAEEILDVLWLSAIHPAGEGAPDDTTASAPVTPPRADAEQPARPNQPAPEPPPVEEEEDTVPLRLASEPAQTPRSEPVPATEVGLGAPRHIGDALALPRALRLLRQVRSPAPHVAVDIDATVAATAAAGGRHLVPRFTRPTERALDLALVVDDSASMRIWSETFDELERLLEQTGAFRTVSRWWLTEQDGNVVITDPSGGRHPPGRLVDPSGRRVVFVATNATGESWYAQGQRGPWDAVASWCAVMPTALVQVLPQHYWSSTALGEPYVTIRAPRPAAPNSEYEHRLAWWAADPGGLALPVVTLEPQALEAWAQATVSGTRWATGITATPPDPEYAPSVTGQAEADVLVNDFLSRASPGAERLARVLASASTMSMPLIGVLQETLVREAGVPELAEVLASDMLEAIRASQPLFRFRPGVREILQRGVTTFEQWDTYAAVSKYLEDRQRLGGPLRALIPDAAGTTLLDPVDEPFAELHQALATRLGLWAAPSGAEPPAVREATVLPAARTEFMTTPPERLREILTTEVSRLSGRHQLTIAEFDTVGFRIWEIKRREGSLAYSVSDILPRSWLRDHLFTENILLVCTALEDTNAVEAMASTIARYRQGLALYCSVDLRESILSVIEEASPDESYWLAVVRRGPSGQLGLGHQLLFPYGSRTGDRTTVRLRILPSDERATVIAVTTFREGEYFPVSVQSIPLPPGVLDLTAELAMPGVVRFHGLSSLAVDVSVRLIRPGHVRSDVLPWEPLEDPRSWNEIVAAIPSRLDFPDPVHLIVAIELTGIEDRDGRRIERAAELIAACDNAGAGASFSVVVYGPHSLTGEPTDGSPVVLDPLMLAWTATGTQARDALTPYRRARPAAAYTGAAQIECALSQIADRLSGYQDEARPVLVTIGSRPPFPPVPQPPGPGAQPPIPTCPRGSNWVKAANRLLTEHPGISFGAITDAGADARMWEDLGRNARADIATVDIQRFAGELGLLETASVPIPLPLSGELEAITEPISFPDEPATAGPQPSRTPEATNPLEALRPVRPRADAGSSAWQSEASIALCGPPGSGKTAYLGALSIATRQAADQELTITGMDEPSERSLSAVASELFNYAFPRATLPIDGLTLKLDKHVTETVGRFRRRKVSRVESTALYLAGGSRELEAPPIEALARSRGIVYMFDPLREAAVGDAYDYTFALCARLAREYSKEARPDSKLPHYVAVCITKFDDLRVFGTARQLGLLTIGPDDPRQLPRVDGDNAQVLFRALLDASATGTGGSAADILENFFHPQRIRYFAISSIGFNVDPATGRFDPDDPQNVLPDPGGPGHDEIRGPIRPINVIEPVTWLADQVLNASTARKLPLPSPRGSGPSPPIASEYRP